MLVTGTLGLAAPATAAAMAAAAAAARAGGAKVFVDVNWRPVFWPDPEAARPAILDFLGRADLVKISDADLEYLYGLDYRAALKDPCSVCARTGSGGGLDCGWGGVGQGGLVGTPLFVACIWRAKKQGEKESAAARPNNRISATTPCHPHHRLHRQVAAKLPRAAGVLVTAGGEGAAYCFRAGGGEGERSGFVPVFEVGDCCCVSGSFF